MRFALILGGLLLLIYAAAGVRLALAYPPRWGMAELYAPLVGSMLLGLALLGLAIVITPLTRKEL